jgi:hypothetical protein
MFVIPLGSRLHAVVQSAARGFDLLFRSRGKATLQDFVDIVLIRLHDVPPFGDEEGRSNFFSRARALYKVTATTPRDLPSSPAISASL